MPREEFSCRGTSVCLLIIKNDFAVWKSLSLRVESCQSNQDCLYAGFFCIFENVDCACIFLISLVLLMVIFRKMIEKNFWILWNIFFICVWVIYLSWSHSTLKILAWPKEASWVKAKKSLYWKKDLTDFPV